jgi:hypothetical protein
MSDLVVHILNHGYDNNDPVYLSWLTDTFFVADKNDHNFKLVRTYAGDVYLQWTEDITSGYVVQANILPIESYAVLGPKPLSADDFANTKLTDLVMISGGGALGGSELDTDGLTMDLFVKDTSEEVTEAIKADATPQYTYTQTGPGRAQNQRPDIAGLVAGIKLSNAVLDETWAIEKVSTKTKPFGRKT